MTLLLLFIVLYFIHLLIPIIVFLFMVYILKKKINWQKYDLIIFIIPFILWFGLFDLSLLKQKSLSNAFIEPVLIGFIVSICMIMRIVLDKHIPKLKLIIFLLFISSFLVTGLYFFTPFLLE